MENCKYVLFVNGEPVGCDDHSDTLVKELYNNNCPLKVDEEETLYGGSDIKDYDDFY